MISVNKIIGTTQNNLADIHINFVADFTIKMWNALSSYGLVGKNVGSIVDKEFTLDDFDCDDLTRDSKNCLNIVINWLNYYRNRLINTGDSNYLLQVTTLLPCAYIQKKSVTIDALTLRNIYICLCDNDEFNDLCDWISSLHFIVDTIKD